MTASAAPVTTPTPATFVLVPGAGGLASYWHRLVPELEARGHTALAVDLPADEDSAGLHEYADAVASAARGSDPLVVVAQSMGGLSAPLVCERLKVSLLVMVNAMIPLPGETGGSWWAATGQAKARAEHAARENRPVTDEVDVLEEFFHDLPAAVVAEVLRQEARVQSETPFAQPFPLDRWPDVPTRVLAGRDDRFFPADFQRHVAEERLGITSDEMPGGHLVALGQPKQLADRLQAYWNDLARGAS
ncbi:alpha/beta hydrolase [Egibacter rhizosphaerae]|uniref:Alpha/beta hydrolase n=1 Tax=Egibacter rhizosphaerae TaxID=1670831 RepID=A0A411YB77_9ACTN|nr:alpha/beta hydrolase [Egibacter rhizosphaerae]QBI18435.1 alpha/beta hydrolase [Egibacter rhizosphaerae]